MCALCGPGTRPASPGRRTVAFGRWSVGGRKKQGPTSAPARSRRVSPGFPGPLALPFPARACWRCSAGSLDRWIARNCQARLYSCAAALSVGASSDLPGHPRASGGAVLHGCTLAWRWLLPRGRRALAPALAGRHGPARRPRRPQEATGGPGGPGGPGGHRRPRRPCPCLPDAPVPACGAEVILCRRVAQGARGDRLPGGGENPSRIFWDF